MLFIWGGFSRICLAEPSWLMCRLLVHHLPMLIVMSHNHSILGPLIFLIYVNEMAGSIDKNILLYTDNTAILVSNKHVDVYELQLGNVLESISNWLVDNKLSLHLGKTESILFCPKRKLPKRTWEFHVMGQYWIETKTLVKYLSFPIDNEQWL